MSDRECIDRFLLRLIRAARAGEFFDCGGKEISASLFREICQGEHGAVSPRGIAIKNARFTEDLDLSYLELNFPLQFVQCQFEEGITLSHSHIDWLHFGGCTFGIQGKTERKWIFRGEYLQLDKGLYILVEKVRKYYRRKDLMEISNEASTEFYGMITLTGARIGGFLDLGGAKMYVDAGEAVAIGREIPAVLDLHNSQVSFTVYLTDGFSIVSQDNKKVRILATHMRIGFLFCYGVPQYYKDELYDSGSDKLLEMRVAGEAINTKINIQLDYTQIGHSLVVRNVGQPVEITLEHATAQVFDARFSEEEKNLLNSAKSCAFEWGLGKVPVQQSNPIKHRLTTIKQPSQAQDNQTQDGRNQGLSFLGLNSFEYTALGMDLASIAGKNAYGLAVWLYQNTRQISEQVGDSNSPQAENSNANRANDSPVEPHGPAFERMAKVLEQIGFEDAFRKVIIAKRVYQRQTLPWYRQILNRVFHFFIGHGYRPWRALCWLFVIWLGASGVLWVNAPPEAQQIREQRVELASWKFVPAEGDVFLRLLEEYHNLSQSGWQNAAAREQICQIVDNYPSFVPPVYALDVLFPFVDLGQESFWTPAPPAKWLIVFRTVFMFVGWILITLFALSFTSLFRVK